MTLVYITRKYSIGYCKNGRYAVVNTAQTLGDPYGYYDNFEDAQKALFQMIKCKY